MAQHFTCDRCGKACLKGREQQHFRKNLIAWSTPDEPNGVEEIALAVTVTRPEVDHEIPDLCRDCLALILAEVSRALVVIHFASRSDAEEAVHLGPALCDAHNPRVTGIFDDVTCSACREQARAIITEQDVQDAAVQS